MSFYIYKLLNLSLLIVFILAFVSIVMWFKKKEGERKTNVLLTALEKGQKIDPELFRTNNGKKDTAKYILLAMLVLGLGTILFGVFMTIVISIESFKQGRIDEDIMPALLILVIGASLMIGYFSGKKLLQK